MAVKVFLPFSFDSYSPSSAFKTNKEGESSSLGMIVAIPILAVRYGPTFEKLCSICFAASLLFHSFATLTA
nr:hypothetical protein [Niallia sp. MER TA 168]